MAVRFGTQIEAELDDIWVYVAEESGSIDVANRVIDSITESFLSALEASSVRSPP